MMVPVLPSPPLQTPVHSVYAGERRARLADLGREAFCLRGYNLRGPNALWRETPALADGGSAVLKLKVHVLMPSWSGERRRCWNSAISDVRSGIASRRLRTSDI